MLLPVELLVDPLFAQKSVSVRAPVFARDAISAVVDFACGARF